MDIEGFGVDPFQATAGELLASVADVAPGPFVVAALMMVDRSTLTPDDALLYLQLHERVTAWWASLQAEALVAATSPEPRIEEFLVLDPRPDHDEERRIRIEDAAREEVAAALRLSPVTAQHRIDHARLLNGPLAATREALDVGDISTAHARVICEAAERMSTSLDRDEGSTSTFAYDCMSLEHRVLPVARRTTVARTRRSALRAIEAIDAEGQRRRREAARATRDVYVTEPCDGIATFVARLDVVAAHAVMAAVEAAVPSAQIAGDCAATIGERRAEALAALVLGSVDVNRGPMTVNLDVAVPLDVLLAGEARGHGVSAEVAPGTVVGWEQVLDLLDDDAVRCTVRRNVVDPVDGHLLDLGRRRYEISEPLRRLIVGRDRTCRFPGCSRRASLCQIDHAVAWDDGGGTDVDNLGALCRRHHQLKTHAGWQMIDSAADGACTWISPTGRRYERGPEPVLSPASADPPAPVGAGPPPF